MYYNTHIDLVRKSMIKSLPSELQLSSVFNMFVLTVQCFCWDVHVLYLPPHITLILEQLSLGCAHSMSSCVL